MLTGIVQEARIQDRDGAPRLIGRGCESFPTIAHIFNDSGYAGEKLETAPAEMNGPAIEIVERTLSWINRCRRLANDWEAAVASSQGMNSHRLHQTTLPTPRKSLQHKELILSRTLMVARRFDAYGAAHERSA